MQQLGEAPASDLAALDAKLAAVREAYRFVDGLIGEAAAGPGPGRGPACWSPIPAGWRAGVRSGRGAARPRRRAGRAGDLGAVSERDVAPTVLHLLGLPRSRELDGRVLEAALDRTSAATTRCASCESYGRRPTPRPAESDFDRDVLEQLKSLGYIQ